MGAKTRRRRSWVRGVSVNAGGFRWICCVVVDVEVEIALGFRDCCDRVGHALAVHVGPLEGVVSDPIPVTPVPIWAVAVCLAHEGALSFSGDVVDLPKTATEEEVLSPESEVELFDALLGGLAVVARLVICFQHFESLARDDFDWAVEAVLAVVDVPQPFVLLRDGSEALREEDCVGVDLHDPVVGHVATVVNHLFPDRYEDPRVERGV
mmetsp:Transcript_29930/g.45081  ORF Transcript_29930/g.45081 Transcript_29930/m.45081 type:complete len:209 (-) Transcript_29930:208-834(-)